RLRMDTAKWFWIATKMKRLLVPGASAKQSKPMRKTIISLMALAAVLAVSSIAFSQDPHDSHWKPCPQCLSAKDKAESRAKTDKLPFDPHDLTGNWGDNQNRIQLSAEVPPFTEYG